MRDRLIILSLICFCSTAAVSVARATEQASEAQFELKPRQEKLRYFPCSQCHRFMQTREEPRQLSAPHPIKLEHGEGRLWCLTCHNPKDRDTLHSLLKEPVEFDRSYRICEQCHADRAKDWSHGAHGKRLRFWSGKRVRYGCTECHNPHSPAIKPRKAESPPPNRIGLPPPVDHGHKYPPVWETYTTSGPAHE